MAEATFAFDLHVLSTPPAFNLSQNQTLQFKSVQRFLPGRNQNLKVLFPLALHLSMNQKKSFSLPPFFAAFVNIVFCHRIVNNFFGNLQKTFCEDFLKPRCFMRRGKLLRSSLLPVNSFSFFFSEIFFPEPSEKGCFHAANATFTLPGRKCQSLFLKNSKKAAPVCRGIRITPLPEYESLPCYLATTRVCPTWRCSPSSLFQRFKSSTLTLSFLEICHRLSFACTL